MLISIYKDIWIFTCTCWLNIIESFWSSGIAYLTLHRKHGQGSKYYNYRPRFLTWSNYLNCNFFCQSQNQCSQVKEEDKTPIQHWIPNVSQKVKVRIEFTCIYDRVLLIHEDIHVVSSLPPPFQFCKLPLYPPPHIQSGLVSS